MFRLLTGNEIPEYLAFCEGRLIGAVLYTRLLVYGTDSRDVMFWIARSARGKAVASLSDGVFTADYDVPFFADEAKAFGYFLGARDIITPEHFSGNGLSVMVYGGSGGSCKAADISPERLREVYEVLYKDGTINDDHSTLSAPGYGLWLTDVSHKLRHGLIHGKCIEQEGKIVSVALTSGETKTTAVLSGVATLREYRGLGYASLVVRSLAGELHDREMTVCAAVRPERVGFYIKNGFHPEDHLI